MATAKMKTTTATDSPAILPAKASLPQMDDHGLTVVSFNVLLPNGNDGWWIYKNYQPHVPEEHRTWSYRRALVMEYLLGMDADVVCIQEASAETFESDFSFMKDAGYSHVLHSKFRFRSATFFKRSKLELVCEKHKDRVLLTGLRLLVQPTPLPEVQAASGESNISTVVAMPLDQSPEVKCSSGSTSTGGQGFSTKDTSSASAPSIAAEEKPLEAAGLPKVSTSSPIPQKVGNDSEVFVSVGSEAGVGVDRMVMIINCHLTGGPAPERRMRQVYDALDVARREAAKIASTPQVSAKPPTTAGTNKGNKQQSKAEKGGKGDKGSGRASIGAQVPVIVCGDFNSDGQTAVWKLLTTGVVPASFRENGYPEVTITSKDKKQIFGPFRDLYHDTFTASTTAATPPPTFMAPMLHPHFLDQDGESVSLRLRVALTEMFNNFARGLTETSARVIYDPTPTRHGGEGDGDSTDEPLEQLPSPPLSSSSSFLPRKGVEAWLLKINRTLGRGSEFRAAEVLMGPGPGGGLTLEDFLSVYAMELQEGKFWGVAHDLHECGVQLSGGMPWVGPFVSRIDHIFYSQLTLEPVGAMEPLSEEERDLVYGGDCLPNSWHPSDHVAIAGAFRFRQSSMQ